jgi:RecJ-like exonuclease
MFLGDYMLDPPDEPPLTVCPECDGTGEQAEPEVDTFFLGNGEVKRVERNVSCPRCDGEGEAFLTDDEVRDIEEEAAITRAEARADARLDRDMERAAW